MFTLVLWPAECLFVLLSMYKGRNRVSNIAEKNPQQLMKKILDAIPAFITGNLLNRNR